MTVQLEKHQGYEAISLLESLITVKHISLKYTNITVKSTFKNVSRGLATCVKSIKRVFWSLNKSNGIFIQIKDLSRKQTNRYIISLSLSHDPNTSCSRYTTLKRRRYNVIFTFWRRNNVQTTSFQRHVPAGIPCKTKSKQKPMHEKRST